MIPSLFYPTISTLDAGTNLIEFTDNLQNIENYRRLGISPYYLGYIKTENIPDSMAFYKNDSSGTKIKLTKFVPDNPPDFAYINMTNNDANSYIASEYGNNDNPFATWYTADCINSMSPINTRLDANQPIYISYTYLVQSWTDPTKPSSYTYVQEFLYPSIPDFIKFLNNETPLTFGMALGDGFFQFPEINLSEFDYHNAYTHIYENNGKSYSVALIITGVGPNQTMFCDNTGTITVGGSNRIRPTLHQRLDGRDFVLDCGDNLSSIYDITAYNGDVQIGRIVYNDFLLFASDLDFDLNDVGATFLRLAGDHSFVYSPSDGVYRVFVAWGEKDMRFMCALYPCLNNTDMGNCYFPEIIDNELTGNFFNYNAIDENGTDWQKSGEIADSTYTENDKPLPDDFDELTTYIHNDENSLPVLSSIRTVSGDAFSTFYRLSMYHVAELGHLIAQMPQDFWEALGTATDYKQANILDYLIALKWYPLDIMDDTDRIISDLQFGFNGVAKITFTSLGTSYKIGNINRVYDMGSVTIPYRTTMRSFLDLEPYTSVTAYIPYIGTTTLQANDVIGHTLNCSYIVDLTTGMCTAIISNEYDTIYIGTGKIGIDISVSGNDILTQSEKMASSYIGAASSAVSNALSLGVSIASENVAGVITSSVSTITDLASSAVGIANSKRGIPESVGCASGFGGAYTHQSPYITVKRPAVSIPAKYGHDVGYVSNQTYTISALSGYTVCQNPDLSGIPATSAELDILKNILCTGFYA